MLMQELKVDLPVELSPDEIKLSPEKDHSQSNHLPGQFRRK